MINSRIQGCSNAPTKRNRTFEMRTVKYCLELSLEQERVVKEKWLPELRNAILNTEDDIKLCKVIQSLVDEWWEQPAATVVD